MPTPEGIGLPGMVGTVEGIITVAAVGLGVPAGIVVGVATASLPRQPVSTDANAGSRRTEIRCFFRRAIKM